MLRARPQPLTPPSPPGFPNRLSARLGRWPRPALAALTLAALTLVGSVDYLTGYEFTVHIFYLLPVLLAAWFFNRRFAALMSFLSVGVWIVGDYYAGATYTNKVAFVWNSACILAFLLVAAFLLDGLRRSLRDLEKRVRERTAALTDEMAERDRLEKEVLESSERERRSIGHDLHDGLGQHLTATALAGQVLGNHLAALKLDPQVSEAARVVEMIEESIELTRSLARGLSPISLESEGLAAGLADLASTTTAQFYVLCQVRCDPHVRLNNPAVAMHLYRIAQEAISNAVRHGRARRLDIVLSQEDGAGVELTIQDDGRGIAPPDGRPEGNGQGLRIMAHRAKMIDARLTILPAATRGTVVRCSLNSPASSPPLRLS